MCEHFMELRLEMPRAKKKDILHDSGNKFSAFDFQRELDKH